MGPMIKFLQAVRRLAELGVKKEDIIEFGKREFGEMTELLSKQVDDIYKRFYKDKGGSIFKDKKPASGTQKPGEVVPFKRKDIVEETKEISKGLGEIKNETNLLPDSERLARGFPSRSVEAIVRTGARELLVRKGIEVGRQDPIDLARQIFGEEVLEKLDNVADEMMMAQSFSDIGKILEREKIVDMQPRKGLDVSKSDELEQITKFDETDRKPNAEGGLNYLMGL